MNERHLTPLQLLEWLDGTLDDPAAARHAARCPVCAMRRKSVEHAGRAGEQRRDPGCHVGPQRLAAYAEGLLPKGERAGVEAHLLACDECLDGLRLLERSLVDEVVPPATPPHVVARALEAFHRLSKLDAASRLGTLRIRRQGGSPHGYAFQFEPQGPPLFAMESISNPSPLRRSGVRRDDLVSRRASDDALSAEPRTGISGFGKPVPGTFSLSAGGHDVGVHVKLSSGGGVEIQLRLPGTLARASVCAVDERGRGHATEKKPEGKRVRWLVPLGPGETRVMIVDADETWEIRVTV